MFRLQQLHIRSEAWRAIACVVPRPPAARHSLEGVAPAGRHAHAQRHSSPWEVACMLIVQHEKSDSSVGACADRSAASPLTRPEEIEGDRGEVRPGSGSPLECEGNPARGGPTRAKGLPRCQEATSDQLCGGDSVLVTAARARLWLLW